MSDVFPMEHKKWQLHCWSAGHRVGITARKKGHLMMTVMDTQQEAVEKMKCWVENKPYYPKRVA